MHLYNCILPYIPSITGSTTTPKGSFLNYILRALKASYGELSIWKFIIIIIIVILPLVATLPLAICNPKIIG